MMGFELSKSAMIISYIKIALRSLRKSKVYSLINISGLAVGMAVAMLIGLWVYDELSFNKFHKNYDLIAQVMQSQDFNGEINTIKAIPIPLATGLRHDYGSDFKYVVLSSWTNPHALSFKEKKVSPLGNYMEPDAAEMLSLEMIEGSRAALQDPSAILLSQSLSRALFGDTNPLGQVVMLDNTDMQVTGIYKDLPRNTTFNNVAFIAPWDLYASSEEVRDSRDNWNKNSFQLFVQIADGKKMSDISAKIKDIKLKSLGEQGGTLKPGILLHAMNRWHLYEEFKNGVNAGGKIQYVWMFTVIGVFVLFLACINFMNLSTARSEKRAKEIGIRKSIGSLRGQLISQFYTESLLFAFVAFVFSLAIVQLTLPFFNELADKEMAILWSEPSLLLLGIGFTTVTGLIAGSYPALYLSSFRPINVLKGTFRVGRSAIIPRKVLIVVQFTVSVILMISALIVFQQIQFAKNRSLGYNKDNLIIVRQFSSDFHYHLSALSSDLLQSGVAVNVAEGSLITKGSRTVGGLDWSGRDQSASYDFMTFGISYEYGKAIDWKFLTGRDFSEKFPGDSSSLILNEAAVEYMGLKDAVGEVITWGKPYTIIGVTKNIVMGSPFEPAKPTVYYLNTEPGFLYVKINPNISMHNVLSEIEKICSKYAPGYPFEYKFVDEEYTKKFGSEERVGKLASISAILAILISCLGLFGMTSFMAEQRTKEIGIRKVLGASVFNLWRSLSNEFVILVLISLLVAIPITYYGMGKWLQNYEYRVNLSVWIFVAASFGTLLIAILTVSFQTIKTSLTNPVNALRSE